MDEQRESRRAKQHEMLEATVVDPNDESDLAEVLEILREARKTVARRRRQLQDLVTGVEEEDEALLSIAEDHAIAPMVLERLAAGGGRPFNELLIELGMPDLTTPTEPHPLQ